MVASLFPETSETAARLAVAALVGLAVGIERQRSGHAAGPDQDFAGTRTFLLIGLLGGLAGLFVAHDAALAGVALVAAAALLTVGAYVVTAQKGAGQNAIDGTTETAALVVLALGVLAGGGALRLAAGLAALVVLALAEKQRLHGWVDRLDPLEMRAAMHFAVLALVVLPVLPTEVATPLGMLTPRATWMLVLIISGLNFVGHLARRIVGQARGYAMTGALGGVVSSTAVTWGFSERSQSNDELRPAFASGVIAASTVLFPRVLLIVLLLNPAVGLATARLLAVPFVVGLAFTWWSARTHASTSTARATHPQRSPLRLGAALQMAAVLQLVLLLMAFVRDQFGTSGVYTTAALFGLTDVDAISIAMTRVHDAAFVSTAAHAIVVAVASNTLLKAIIAAALGRGVYRTRTVVSLTAMLAALVAVLLWLP